MPLILTLRPRRCVVGAALSVIVVATGVAVAVGVGVGEGTP